jgi:SAM-dependent methyltransferase
MRDYGIATFGDRLADVYDEWSGVLTDADVAAEFLAGLAGDGPGLELGVGTGRVALPLAGHGIEVHGIDASPAMVERLRAKPGGQDISLRIGDFADVPADGEYSLIYVVDSTFYLLLSEEKQRRCLANVARRLRGDGVLVVQALVPHMNTLREPRRILPTRVESDRVFLLAAAHDPASQRVERLEMLVTDAGVRLFPVCYRYVWPSELDLMAELAGLRLRHRWGGWRNEPFAAEGLWNVSVYEPFTPRP